jgi:hypothetical protein
VEERRRSESEVASNKLTSGQTVELRIEGCEEGVGGGSVAVLGGRDQRPDGCRHEYPERVGLPTTRLAREEAEGVVFEAALPFLV